MVMAKITRYLRRVDGGMVFNFSLALAKRKDMIECDLKGNLISAKAPAKEKKLTKKEREAAAKAIKEEVALAAAAEEEANKDK